MATPLANKVSVITGAASGMGLATAKLFLSRGASLSLTGINSKGLQQFQDSEQSSKVLTNQYRRQEEREGVPGQYKSTIWPSERYR